MECREGRSRLGSPRPGVVRDREAVSRGVRYRLWDSWPAGKQSRPRKKGHLRAPGSEAHVRHRPRQRTKEPIKNPVVNSYNSVAKNPHNPFKRWARDLNIFPKKIYKWPTGT